MLTFLRIRNLAIVKDLSLSWGAGLNLLTGETGAGKSILVEALGLALGDRASAELLRAGESKGEVEAVFELDGTGGQARALLASAGIEPEGNEVIVRRELADGSRARQFLCDTPVALSTLRRFGDLMVEIQGQHQHHALLAADAQRDALDRFAGLDAARERLGALAGEANGALTELGRLEDTLRDPRAQLEYLRFQLRELEALGPIEGEEEALRAERGLLQQASRRRELAEDAWRLLYEEEGSAVERVGRALAELRSLAGIDPSAEGSARAVEQARQLIEEAVVEIRDYRERAEPDPARLEEVEGRLAAYERLARKHGCPGGALGARRGELLAEATALESGGESLEAARRRCEELRGRYLAAARELSAKRSAAARKLGEALARELGALAMGPCDVAVAVVAGEPEPGAALRREGIDQVQLLLAPNPGEPPRPLAEIASGGELSRVMLAVNTVLGKGRRRRTLVYDEVDAGIGGRTAAVVGEKLRSLAAAHQVIVVTHLPQIASLADRHFAVEKRVAGGRTLVHVRELDREGRVAEIARMMGGREITTVARRHAEDMLRKSGGRAERRTT